MRMAAQRYASTMAPNTPPELVKTSTTTLGQLIEEAVGLRSAWLKQVRTALNDVQAKDSADPHPELMVILEDCAALVFYYDVRHACLKAATQAIDSQLQGTAQRAIDLSGKALKTQMMAMRNAYAKRLLKALKPLEAGYVVTAEQVQEIFTAASLMGPSDLTNSEDAPKTVGNGLLLPLIQKVDKATQEERMAFNLMAQMYDLDVPEDGCYGRYLALAKEKLQNEVLKQIRVIRRLIAREPNGAWPVEVAELRRRVVALKDMDAILAAGLDEEEEEEKEGDGESKVEALSLER
ncbi:hypothetical protein BAUCODRAFT_161311 [Baudoinia panamericana UAMH 10762]|uniref:Uncharacterized protein n=1 Tax=Baudoinia panamericana (strain UAMH 10762) TaxID=717646 RepID=M2NME7_BAUPA|nr:uncharacterized protein BAUCODRAFT_161311 [Baudoinia panamericana UAMH 10762]EMD00356.1 hypothetical protein BAUCODRAFT_161311 [Baudoinia panamericana UAMH 10762]